MHIDVEDFYKRYAPMVLRRCRFLLRNEEKALDAMQDTFVKILMYRERLDGRYPSSLLFRIATNICLNIISREKRGAECVYDEILDNIAISDDIEKKIEAEDLLDRIFLKEKSSTREIAVMHYVDNMTLEEVADEVGLSVSGVRKRLRQLKLRGKDFEESLA